MTSDRSAHDRVPRRSAPTGRRSYRTPTGIAQVRCEDTGAAGTVLLRASGEFDSQTVDCLREALGDAARAGSERTLLDLSQVTFGDSAFLHALITAHYSHDRLVIIGPLASQPRRLFQLTGTQRLFHIAMDPDSADLA